MFREMREIVRQNLIEQLPSIIDASDLSRPKADSQRMDQGFFQQLTALFAATRGSINREVGERQIQFEAEKFATETDNMSRDNLAKAFKSAIGVDLTGDDSFISEQIQIFTTNNVNLIQNVQNELMTEIERLTLSGIQKGERASVIKQKILGRVKDKEGFTGRFKKAETRAKLIARDQITKLNGNINETRQKSLGVRKYKWRDSGDNRVRESHKLDGEIFFWDKNKSESGKTKPRGSLNPGEDFQCRCYAEPVIDTEDL